MSSADAMAETPVAMPAAPLARASADPVRLAALLCRYRLHPERDVHPSWWPADWPPSHRRPEAYGSDARSLLARWWRLRLARAVSQGDAAAAIAGDEAWPALDHTAGRLALLPSAVLRRLAWQIGLLAHAPWLDLRRGPLARRLGRIDPALLDYLRTRAPSLDALALDGRPLQARPGRAGRLLPRRGARLLLGLVAEAGPGPVERVRHALPRWQSDAPLPRLGEAARRQLDEALRLSLIPERWPAWDWLY